MKIQRVRVSYGVTKNLGNYESLRLEYTVESTLDPGEGATGVIDKTRQFLKKKIDTDIGKLP